MFGRSVAARNAATSARSRGVNGPSARRAVTAVRVSLPYSVAPVSRRFDSRPDELSWATNPRLRASGGRSRWSTTPPL